VWRHAVNGYMEVTGTGQDYLIIGPLRGGGQLVEVGLIADCGVSLTCRYALGITGSPAATIGNLRGATSLIHRSNDASGVFGVPTMTMTPTSAQHLTIVLPFSVRLDTGGQFIIVGIQVQTAEKLLNTVAWALAVGGPGYEGYRKPMVNGQGLGVEDGLDR